MTSEFSIAAHALVYLYHKDTTLSSEQLAENICTNSARVRKVMAQLKRAGLVATKEGIDGGYLLRGDAAAVTLRTVADAVGAKFVASSWRSGDADMECLVASGMADIMDGLFARLDALCREELERTSILDLNNLIFKKEGSL